MAAGTGATSGWLGTVRRVLEMQGPPAALADPRPVLPESAFAGGFAGSKTLLRKPGAVSPNSGEGAPQLAGAPLLHLPRRPARAEIHLAAQGHGQPASSWNRSGLRSELLGPPGAARPDSPCVNRQTSV
jgi:hypothetical protein